MATGEVNVNQVPDEKMDCDASESDKEMEEEVEEEKDREDDYNNCSGSDGSVSSGSNWEDEYLDESESSNSDESDEESDSNVSDELWFISRDKHEVWRSQPFEPHLWQKKLKKFKEIEGPTVWARLCVTSIVDSFLLFFRQQLIDILCKWTNKEGKSIYGDKWHDVDLKEVKKYLAVVILIGVCKSKGEAVKNLFCSDIGRPIISKILPINRFKHITRAMRFDDATNRRKGVKDAKLAPIREFFNIWNGYLREAYVPSAAMTVGEQLITFKGRCPVKRYMPITLSKYGVKFWMICDAKSSYVWKVQIHLGRQSEDINQGERIVKDLTSEVFGSKRNINGGDFFTSLSLARYLYQKKLTFVGPVAKNKGFLPPEFVNTKGRKVGSTIFGFQDNCALVSYCPRKGEVVPLISTLHETAAINANTKRPEILEYYNETKAAVEKADQMMKIFSCRTKTRRWPMVVFSNLVDISALNAFIIYTSIYSDTLNTKSLGKRQFLISLAKELAGIKSDKEPEVPKTPKKLGVKRRCYVCPYVINRKSKTFCSVCYNNICKEHSVVICNKCK